MSVYWNSRTRALSPYVPGEQPRDRKYIKLNTNENPYPPSPATVAAVRESAAGTLRLYSDPTALEFRKAVAARYGTTVERVFVGNGSDEILAFVFGAFFESGPAYGADAAADSRAAPAQGAGTAQGAAPAPVLFPDITYSFYPVYADLWGIPFRTPALAEDFSIRVEDYLGSSGGGRPGGGEGGGASCGVGTACGGVIFPNPNAPTGLALPLKDILRVAESQREAGKVLVVDEAYVDFGAESAVAATREFPNLLTVHTLSKSRSLAGLRLGFAIGPEDLIEGLRRVKDRFNSYTLDRCALAGGAAAMADSAYYDEANARVVATRERTAAALGKLGFQGPTSTANFLFVRHPAVSGEAIFKGLREKGILVRWFNKPRIDQYLRISIGTDEEMDALVKACAELAG